MPSLQRHPLAWVFVGSLAATLVYFFGFLKLYGGRAIADWAAIRWRPEYNQEHSWLVPFLFLFLIWFHRKELKAAPKAPDYRGLLLVGLGIVFYVVAARALQPRLAIFSLSFFVLGITIYLWGPKVGRMMVFPSAMLLFMIPLAAIEQATFRLQFLVTGVIEFLSKLIGIQISTVGTTLKAADGSWGFDIAEGCSGIRSLIAIVMLTAMYVHVFEKQFWKKVLILAFSGVFAVIGNAGRIFTIIVLAKLGFPGFAGGIYHDYSSFIFFPIALLAMISFAKLLNIRLNKAARRASPVAKQVSYDY